MIIAKRFHACEDSWRWLPVLTRGRVAKRGVSLDGPPQLMIRLGL